MANDLVVVDHDALVEREIATEYSASNLVGHIKALLEGHTELDQVMVELSTLLDIDAPTAEYDWVLDLIGRIVGQPRTLVDASEVVFFGLAGDLRANSFGTVLDASVGGRWRELDEPLTGFRQLNNEEYKTFIRARIAKNHSRSRPEDVIALFKFIFKTDLIIVDTAMPRPGHGRVVIGRTITLNERALLLNNDILPRTAGVTYNYGDFPDVVFSFAALPQGGGFGTLTDPTIGGSFIRNLN